MALKVDNNLLRRSTPSEVASYIRNLAREYPEHQITRHLFDMAALEAISPVVLSIWLSIAQSPKTVLEGLKQEYSTFIRLAALKRLCKLLETKRWREVWDRLDSTRGILSVLEQFSVVEVKAFIKRVSRLKKGPNAEERGKLISEVLRGLHPSLYPAADHKTADDRVFIDTSGYSWYASLLATCDSMFVNQVIYDGDPSLLKYETSADYLLLTKHYDLFQRQCTDGRSLYQVIEKQYLLPLVYTVPPILSSIPGFTESMRFSVELLGRLSEQTNDRSGNDVYALDILILPLMKKTLRRIRLIGPQQAKYVVSVCMKFIDAHPEEAERLQIGGYSRDSFLYYIVQLWAKNCPTFEPMLVAILSKIPCSEDMFWGDLAAIYRWVRMPLRYRILKIYLLHYGKRNIDISSDEDLRKLTIKTWPSSVFSLLDPTDAFQLLIKLSRARKDEFLEPDPQRHVWIRGFRMRNQSRYLETYLFFSKKKIYHNHKKAAMRSREQTQRASYAASALTSAIETKSLKLFGETLEWAKRYVKDHLTAKTIFAISVIGTSEANGLLSGIPLKYGKLENLSASDIGTRIVESNKIILLTLDIVCLALREPSFNKNDWKGLLGVLSQAVNFRLQRTATLQRDLELSDDQVYALVWEDTLSLALRFESICIQPGHDNLLQDRPTGPVSLTWLEKPKTLAIKPYLRFVDNLARERDAMWKAYRPTVSPTVTTLPSPFPRGLPIQLMLGFLEIGEDWAAGLTPFLFSRAEKVVFPDPDEVLREIPDDDDLRSAIGIFIDSYSQSLNIYVNQSPSSEESKKRKMRAWKYAIEKLSPGRMDVKEATLFWRQIFNWEEFEIEDDIPKTSMKYPLLPLDGDPNETQEWNPADGYSPPPIIEQRELVPTFLDLSIGHELSRYPLPTTFQMPSPRTEWFHPPTFQIWHLDRLAPSEKALPDLREGLTVSALLYIDSKINGPRSILTKPFPSPSEPRYPSLYLADEFLQREDLNRYHAYWLIRRNFINTVPPTLLVNLATAALDVLSKGPTTSSKYEIEGLAIHLLTLVTLCDRPHLAIDLVLRTIFERPDSSSWHRQLLNKTFLNRLSASHARDLIIRFSNGIQEKMRIQKAYSQLTAEEKAREASSSKAQPYLKITTVKLLAQLFDESHFVSESFAIEILTQLLQTSSHIDIRVAVLQSLATMLAACPDESARGHKIISAFKIIIPIAGDIDWRSTISEEEWKKAESSKSLPEVFEETSSGHKTNISLGPLIELITGLILNRGVTEKWRNEVAHQILLPIIQRSIASNTRWLKIFAAKYGVDLDTLDIPMLPVNPRLLTYTFGYDWINSPPSLFELHHSFVMTNISPSQKLRDFTMTLTDPKVRKLPETQHWVLLYGRWSEMFELVKGYSDSAILNPKLPPEIRYKTSKNHNGEESVQILQVDDYAFDIARAIVTNYPEQSYFGTFMGGIRHQPWGKQAVQRIISFIDSLRTSEWQRNPARQPSALPSTLKYKLWLLPYPEAPARDGSKPKRESIFEFAHGILSFLIEISSDGRPYHDDLPIVRAAALESKPCYQADIACVLGFPHRVPPLVGMLSVEIAQKLFEAADVPLYDETLEEAQKVIMHWKNSEIESVRLRGTALDKVGAYRRSTWQKLLLGNKEL